MNQVEQLYENMPKNQLFFPRKITLEAEKTVLCGAPKVGKTTLALDYLSNCEAKTSLYIDLNDTRLYLPNLEKDLQVFMKKSKINTLVIDNYDFNFAIPMLENIILICEECSKHLPGYKKQNLAPLDFEEYISFDKRHFNIEHLFNLYTHTGTLPQFIAADIHYPQALKVQALFQGIHTNPINQALFAKLCVNQSQKTSLHQIYIDLKKNMKISKDKLYAIVEDYKNSRQLFFVEKFGSSKAAKKIYLYDFALKNAYTFKKDFLKTFENMVFLEIEKRYNNISYTDLIDFFCADDNLAILCIPFLTEEFIKMRLSKMMVHLKSLHVSSVEIISVGNEGHFLINGIECTLIPFWEWSLSD